MWRGSISRLVSQCGAGFLPLGVAKRIKSHPQSTTLIALFANRLSEFTLAFDENRADDHRAIGETDARGWRSANELARSLSLPEKSGACCLRCERRRRRTGTLSPLLSRSSRAHLFSSTDRGRGYGACLHWRLFSEILSFCLSSRCSTPASVTSCGFYSSTLQFAAIFKDADWFSWRKKG